ncbi:MAG: SMC-Scp complex subunit ScpB, partial [Anaerolineales bacterium]
MIPPGVEPGAHYSTSVPSARPADGKDLTARVEALLFVSPAPTTTAQLALALGVALEDIERALVELAAEGARRGIRLQEHGGRFQLTTAPEFAAEVQAFLQLEATARLTRAALEVLAIVAYHQPATRPYIDSIRGVNSESALATLVRYGLIEEAGRADGPGRPILYSTTPDFLRHFGLEGFHELPPLPQGTMAPGTRSS